jgi:hypothetical protein
MAMTIATLSHNVINIATPDTLDGLNEDTVCTGILTLSPDLSTD